MTAGDGPEGRGRIVHFPDAKTAAPFVVAGEDLAGRTERERLDRGPRKARRRVEGLEAAAVVAAEPPRQRPDPEEASAILADRGHLELRQPVAGRVDAHGRANAPRPARRRAPSRRAAAASEDESSPHVRRMTSTISERKKSLIGGPQVPVPRETTSVIPSTS